MPKQIHFSLPIEYDEQQLCDNIVDLYSLQLEESITQPFTLYDTFDWRLFDKSYVLYHTETTLSLRHIQTSEIIAELDTETMPKFIWDMPDSDLKEALAPLIKMRALLPLTTLSMQASTYRVLNEDEKTVARIEHQSIRPTTDTASSAETDTPPLTIQVILKSVRGYQKTIRQLSKHFSKVSANEVNLYDQAMQLVDKEPGDYSSKAEVTLIPDMPASSAAKRILLHQLTVLRANEAGIKADIDTEFLHDFRVATRRTRSVLSQVKGVFPAETTLAFKQKFAQIGRISNQLRDLDVYLLNEESYIAMLPEVLQPDIEPLFDFLREKRVQALAEVIEGLNGELYQETLKEWENFLHEPTVITDCAPNAAMPVIKLAQIRIYKRYRRVVKMGKRLLKSAPDEELHELRIECKKLRYLMEFFSSLFPTDEITTLIKQLKRLQDNLGDFNDLCVQEDYLQHISLELPVTDTASRQALLAIGSLISTLAERREQVKAEFAGRFNQFAETENHNLFRKLFRPQKEQVTS